jgi:hypothetical protein
MFVSSASLATPAAGAVRDVAATLMADFGKLQGALRKGGDGRELVAAAKERTKARLDAAVEAGRLSRGQADAILTGLSARMDGLIGVKTTPRAYGASAKAAAATNLLDLMQQQSQGTTSPIGGLFSASLTDLRV